MAPRTLSAIKGLDAFPKVEDNYVARTQVGGLTTALVAVALVVLVASEWAAFATPATTFQFVIDTNAHQPLQVNLDVNVGLACKYITVLLWDNSGAMSSDLGRSVKLDPEPMDVNTVVNAPASGYSPQLWKSVRRTIRDATILRDMDAKVAAGARGLPPSNPNDPQGKAQYLDGCHIYGSFEINKVAGRLQIMAQGHGQGNVHTPHEVLNFTHRINHLSFGSPFPGIVNPLDGQVEVSQAPFQMFQYFVSVVPTVYVDSSENKLFTNQYAVTEYNRVVDHEKGSHGIPGILIKFDMEPLLVRITEQYQSWFHFLTRMSGIVGGIFVCTGLIKGGLDWAISQVTGTPAA